MKNKNTSVSANNNLVADENGNINCTNCENCTNCTDCVDCTNCTDCVDCTNCTNCGADRTPDDESEVGAE